MEVQIFGTKKCAETRKAQRFFSERRVKAHFVDLQQRAASPGELRRFVAEDPLLLRTPLVRWKHRLTIGFAPDTWTAWLTEP